MRVFSIVTLSAWSAVVLLGSLSSPARACDVSVGSEVVVHTGTPVMVRMAWDRSDDVPAVLWLDSTANEIAYTRWTGPDDGDWEAPTVVDKGDVHAPPGFDWGGWRMVALAFDSAGQPHLVIAGEETAGSGTMGLWYVHRTVAEKKFTCLRKTWMKGKPKETFFVRLFPRTSDVTNIKKDFCLPAIFFNHINSTGLFHNKTPPRSIACMSHRQRTEWRHRFSIIRYW